MYFTYSNKMYKKYYFNIYCYLIYFFNGNIKIVAIRDKIY